MWPFQETIPGDYTATTFNSHELKFKKPYRQELLHDQNSWELHFINIQTCAGMVPSKKLTAKTCLNVSWLCLVAPYCAIPRDYLNDTPLLRAMGFLVSQHGPLGAIPPPPFLSVSPLESMRSGGAISPPQKGISAILARHPIKPGQSACDTPLCDTISKGYLAIWGYLALGR